MALSREKKMVRTPPLLDESLRSRVFRADANHPEMRATAILAN
jgi:hypothetical protein